MRINWKVRFKNPHFWASIGLSILTPILAYFGLTGADMSTWAVLGETLLKAITNPYVCFLVVVSVWNAIKDPTTARVGDSKRAMSYSKPYKDVV